MRKDAHELGRFSARHIWAETQQSNTASKIWLAQGKQFNVDIFISSLSLCQDRQAKHVRQNLVTVVQRIDTIH